MITLDTALRQGGVEIALLVLADEHHLDGLDALLNDERVARWLGGKRTRETLLATIQKERQHFVDHGFAPWVVLDRRTGEVMGRGGLRRVELFGHPEVELFYAVAPPRMRTGLATLIATRALGLGFRELGLDSVVALTMETNQASQRLLEKVGMVRDGTFEHTGLPHVLFRVTKEEFLEADARAFRNGEKAHVHLSGPPKRR